MNGLGIWIQGDAHTGGWRNVYALRRTIAAIVEIPATALEFTAVTTIAVSIVTWSAVTIIPPWWAILVPGFSSWLTVLLIATGARPSWP